MEKTAISLFIDGKSSELAKFMKGIKTDEVMVISKWKDYCIGFTWNIYSHFLTGIENVSFLMLSSAIQCSSQKMAMYLQRKTMSQIRCHWYPVLLQV